MGLYGFISDDAIRAVALSLRLFSTNPIRVDVTRTILD